MRKLELAVESITTPSEDPYACLIRDEYTFSTEGIVGGFFAAIGRIIKSIYDTIRNLFKRRAGLGSNSGKKSKALIEKYRKLRMNKLKDVNLKVKAIPYLKEFKTIKLKVPSREAKDYQSKKLNQKHIVKSYLDAITDAQVKRVQLYRSHGVFLNQVSGLLLSVVKVLNNFADNPESDQAKAMIKDVKTNSLKSVGSQINTLKEDLADLSKEFLKEWEITKSDKDDKFSLSVSTKETDQLTEVEMAYTFDLVNEMEGEVKELQTKAEKLQETITKMMNNHQKQWDDLLDDVNKNIIDEETKEVRAEFKVIQEAISVFTHYEKVWAKIGYDILQGIDSYVQLADEQVTNTIQQDYKILEKIKESL